jgi:hypothetical protein
MKRKNTNGNEPSNRPHFEWQERVAAIPRTVLKDAYKVVLWRLALHRNRETGRCDPSELKLAKGAGVSLRTVKRAIAKGEELGLLPIGRSNSGLHYDHNNYRFLHEGVSSQTPVAGEMEDEGVSSQTPVGGEMEDEGVSSQTPNGCPVWPPNIQLNEGDTSCPQEKEIGGSAAPLGGHSLTLGPPQGKGRKKDRHRGAQHRGARHGAAHGNGADDAAVRAGFEEMRRNNSARPYADDIDEDYRACCRALQLIDRDTLLANHKAYVKATVEGDGAKYLKSIAAWCNGRGWEKPLPTKASKANGSRRYNGADRRRGNSGKSAEEIVKERILKRQGVTS